MLVTPGGYVVEKTVVPDVLMIWKTRATKVEVSTSVPETAHGPLLPIGLGLDLEVIATVDGTAKIDFGKASARKAIEPAINASASTS